MEPADTSPPTSERCSEAPAVRVLPILPPEVVLSIIRHNLAPPKTYEAVAERYPLLLAYSLVCHAWCALAQAELFAHVLLKDVESAQLFVAACSASGAPQGWRTISLRVGRKGAPDQLYEEAKAILEPVTAGLVPRLREAWMRGIGDISLSMFAKSPELHSLHLHQADITESRERSQRCLVPTLRHLSLHRCSFTVTARDSLSQEETLVAVFMKEALPRLASFRALHSFGIDQKLGEEGASTPTPLSFFSGDATECDTITINAWPDFATSLAYWPLRLPAFKVLTRLAFAALPVGPDADASHLRTFLSAVPTELEVLRLSFLSPRGLFLSATTSVLELLDLDLPCLRKIRRLVIRAPPAWTPEEEEKTPEALLLWESLAKRCAELEIELVERTRALYGDDMVEDWEKIDEQW